MVVAVAVVGVVELAVNEVVRVIAVGDGFVSTLGAVGVAGAGGMRVAGGGIGGGDGDGGFVEVVAVRGMEMAVVEVGNLAADADGGVAATFSVDMGMAAVDGVVGTHGGPRNSVATQVLGATGIKFRSYSCRRNVTRLLQNIDPGRLGWVHVYDQTSIK